MSGEPALPDDGVYATDLSKARRVVFELRRNWHWGRTWGWRKLLEEHDALLHQRARRWARKRAWVLRNHHRAGHAQPVLLVGLQRSGTNMIVKGLDESPRVASFNENDRRAFVDYRLRDVDRIRQLIGRTRHELVLLKPLCDSHRTPELLERLDLGVRPKAVWVYRDVDGRVRSAIAKFGSSNLTVLRDFAAGTAGDRWQMQGMSDETRAFLAGFDYATMSKETGAALIWYVRNQLYFDLGLDAHPDVLLVSYNRFLADPERSMRRLCDFVGIPFEPSYVAHVAARPSAWSPPLQIDDVVRERCEDVMRRLDAAADRAAVER